VTARCTSCVRGDCVGPEVCRCSRGWDGASCDVCASGYTGTNCDQCMSSRHRCSHFYLFFQVSCSNGCGHGYCSGPNTCTCDPSYVHNDGILSSPCDVPTCPSPCLNGGVCQAFGTQVQCKCPDGWIGSICNVQTCSANCDRHGTCSGNMYKAAIYAVFILTPFVGAFVTRAGPERIATHVS
jgi:hypothetical protein